MKLLENEHILLRALEPEDLEVIFKTENDTRIWEVSDTLAPFSKKLLADYIDNAHQDIFEAKQLRLVICETEGRPIGLIDLYDYSPRHQRAGVGIVISEAENRDRGYGREALTLLCDYAFRILQIHQLYASVAADNGRSRHLFEKLGFTLCGIKKDWVRTASGFQDVLFLQKIREDVS